MKKKSKFRRERERGDRGGARLTGTTLIIAGARGYQLWKDKTGQSQHTHTHIYEHTYNTHICKHMYKLAFTDVVSLFKTEFHPSSFYMWVSMYIRCCNISIITSTA